MHVGFFVVEMVPTVGLDLVWPDGALYIFFYWVWRIVKHEGSDVLGLLFSVCCGIWLNRNQLIFNQRHPAEEVAFLVVNCFDAYIYDQQQTDIAAYFREPVVWMPPIDGKV